jgi:mono/diheme cytochrome c family protein
MLDGFRRLAIVFAVISLLTPSVNLMAGTISNGKSRKVIAEHSSSNCGSAASATHGNSARAGITQQARAEAAEIFESRCVACHGTEGRGDGPAAANLNPKPRDFHNLKWQKSIDDASLARAIVYGGRSVGVSAEMAPNPDLENEPAVVAALVERVRGWCK